MRSAGYTDLERGERGSSEEHLTVTQFKVEREQERLEGLTEQTAQKAQEVAVLGKKIERYQNHSESGRNRSQACSLVLHEGDPGTQGV